MKHFLKELLFNVIILLSVLLCGDLYGSHAGYKSGQMTACKVAKQGFANEMRMFRMSMYPTNCVWRNDEAELHMFRDGQNVYATLSLQKAK